MSIVALTLDISLYCQHWLIYVFILYTLAQPKPKLTAPTRVWAPVSELATVSGPPLSPWKLCFHLDLMFGKEHCWLFGLESSNCFIGLCMNKGRYRHSPHKHLYQPLLLGSERNLKLPFTSLIINSSMVTLRNLHRAWRT